jgi:hypothetical protein
MTIIGDVKRCVLTMASGAICGIEYRTSSAGHSGRHSPGTFFGALPEFQKLLHLV